jgi:hypothetical protein
MVRMVRRGSDRRLLVTETRPRGQTCRGAAQHGYRGDAGGWAMAALAAAAGARAAGARGDGDGDARLRRLTLRTGSRAATREKTSREDET